MQPNGTEGYRTAEVTLGGVDTHELSSRTMEARKVPGLYFIGEVMDVTGWLGVQLPVGMVFRLGLRPGAGRSKTGAASCYGKLPRFISSDQESAGRF